MEYESVDTARLKLIESRLKYDANHIMDEHKRNMAALEWFKVEAELRKRSGLSGIIWQLKKLLRQIVEKAS